jgi:hypothetical protein
MKTECAHNSVTVRPPRPGWVCADCGVGLFSLMCPIPLPTIERALEALMNAPQQPKA